MILKFITQFTWLQEINGEDDLQESITDDLNNINDTSTPAKNIKNVKRPMNKISTAIKELHELIYSLKEPNLSPTEKENECNVFVKHVGIQLKQ